MKNSKIYEISLPDASQPIQRDHLLLGGKSPGGQNISFTSFYMLRNDRPIIPVMGEFHFTRCDHHFWDDALTKIKAGGIDILATYVFWNHIEEEQGQYHWSGNNNLRRFIERCHHHGFEVILRIGPFAHGECRNGGFPDWLYGQPFPLRSNDTRYLKLIEEWYGEIARQVDGLLFKDEGPIIGLQLDNEYMHCGAPWEVTFRQGTEWVSAGTDGVSHMVKLKELALKAGFNVPIYTATGWLHSPIIEDELLPMQGGYAFTPWNPDPNYVQPPTREFLFRNRYLNPVLGGEPTYEASRYPYACCEIGGGIQITYYHRPVVPPESVEALALMNLAGGANLIGYYMYHGGTHPIGKHSYMNEFTVPRLSYDFQAPIREFGQISDTYRYLRLLHMFLHDFGEVLAPMDVLLPSDQDHIVPEDVESLRYMLRSHGNSAFIFLNTYQDHVEMQDIEDIRFKIQIGERTIHLPHDKSLTLQRNISTILPLGMSLNGISLIYATVQPLCHIAGEQFYVFFSPPGLISEYAFDNSTFDKLFVHGGTAIEDNNVTYVRVDADLDCLLEIHTIDDQIVKILTLTREQAEACSKQHVFGRDHLILSQSTVTVADEELILYSAGQESVELVVYPPFSKVLTSGRGEFSLQNETLFTRYSLEIPSKVIGFDVEYIQPGKALIHLDDDVLTGCHNVILQVDYIGDMGEAFIKGNLIHDNFYNGTTWEIGLGQIAPDAQDILLIITPLKSSSGEGNYIPTGMAFLPENELKEMMEIRSIRVVTEHKITIR